MTRKKSRPGFAQYAINFKSIIKSHKFIIYSCPAKRCWDFDLAKLDIWFGLYKSFIILYIAKTVSRYALQKWNNIHHVYWVKSAFTKLAVKIFKWCWWCKVSSFSHLLLMCTKTLSLAWLYFPGICFGRMKVMFPQYLTPDRNVSDNFQLQKCFLLF